jgi:hypothetical protein
MDPNAVWAVVVVIVGLAAYVKGRLDERHHIEWKRYQQLSPDEKRERIERQEYMR